MANNILPPKAFDGQIFIDAFRVKWKFDGSAQCWVKVGKCTDIPVASETQTGLLSSKLKQLIDSIPEGGGHFGIIAQPLLSFVPKNCGKPLFKGSVVKSIINDSGTRIDANLERNFTPKQFSGKILIFDTGILAKKAFLIFDNDEKSIFIEGDASSSKEGDKFKIVEPVDLNPNGVLIGDIMLVSDSIDITCVDNTGAPLDSNNKCSNLDIIQCDNADNPPGLSFEVNKDFLDSLCVIVPGCKGPRGDRGDPGDPGDDGTGDGPQGDQGDPGEDAPPVGHTFTGVKIIDIDDIYDTAIVSMELDAENGKLNIVRAKVRTPDNSTPASRFISVPISRGIAFKSTDSFDYEITKPVSDNITTDVDVLKYPTQYDNNSEVKTTTVTRVKLSNIIDEIIKYYEDKLAIINDQYNKELKTYIEGKDEQARNILAGLAQKVAECEFELPIDFCLGISPADCKQSAGAPQAAFNFPLASTILSLPPGDSTVTAISLGLYKVPAVVSSGSVGGLTPPNPSALSSDLFVAVKYPNNKSVTSTVTLPQGFYVIKLNPKGSAIRSDSSGGWLIYSNTSGVGLEATIVLQDGTTFVASGTPPAITFNSLDKTATENAYASASFPEQVIVVELTLPGSIHLSAFLPGSFPQGAVNVEVLSLQTPPGTTIL